MKRPSILPALVLAALLLACVAAVYVTRDTAGPQISADGGLVADEDLLITANRLAALAETADEQNQAREAVHLADHQLDQAFASALRQALAYRPPSSGPLHDLTTHIDDLKSQIAADQARISQLGKPVAASAAADQLELANAQLALDQDELSDAQQDLARQGGDPHAVLERDLQQHESAQHQAAAQPSRTAGPTDTLAEQIRSWLFFRSLGHQLELAQQATADQATSLAMRHNQLEKGSASSSSAPGAPAANTTDQIANLHRLSDQRKTLAEFDQRVQDCQQLTTVYRAWNSLVQTRLRAVAHLLLTSVAAILGIILIAFLINWGVSRLFHESDLKRLHQFRVIAAVSVQLVALGLILLVVFGPPSQLSTIIGLATAGLTVVLKDVIVSFFGWFTLMGKNGIRVGDWVEINGVSGEVIEIGVLRTVLLELGNWTDTGHPTGRQVAFSNSYAMEGHYFNFSTVGQWLWDELFVPLPSAADPHVLAEEIRKLVERETAEDSAKAGQDWERATTQFGARGFSATPAVSLRPGLHGLEVVVRYITRAPERNAVKARLFQLIIAMMQPPEETVAAVVGAASPDLTAPQVANIVREGETNA